jgi:hypothetical protein
MAAVDELITTDADDRVIGYHSFDKVFDTADENLEALFDRVLGVLCSRS